MYIAPNSTIKILHNIPLDPTYDHTLYFDTASAQSTYFSNKAKYSLTAQSYQRVQRGYMRVEIQAENLYDCNYLMFQNTAFGTKWFYAFIKSVEYVNHSVSQIEFEIDVMQTWHFDYTLDYCFVEREHSATDGYYENIIAEDLDIGDEYAIVAWDTYDMSDMRVCVLTNKKVANGTTFPSDDANGIYTPVGVINNLDPAYPHTIDRTLFTNNTDCYDLIEDDIICVYQYPAFITVDTPTPIPDTATTVTKNITPNKSTLVKPAAQGGYSPRNTKLFTYPYNFLLVSNNSGQTATFRWEDWPLNNEGTFEISGVFMTTPTTLCYPTNYRGKTNCYEDGLIYNNFPQCAWPGDTFKAWWAQNKASYTNSSLTNVASSTAGGAASGFIAAGPVGAVGGALVGSITAAKKATKKIQDIKHTASQTYGQTQTDSLNPGMGRVEYTFYSLSVKYQYAQIIDDFFDRYGYATNRNKIPNRNVRPHWTYTQTVGCTISGVTTQTSSGSVSKFIPGDDAKKICDIYNNGITFWNNGSEVGNYSLDNRPRYWRNQTLW